MHRKQRSKASLAWFLLVIATLVMTGAGALHAHAILVKSQPAANAKVTGPSIPVVLTFNSRIDQARSHLTLQGPDGAVSALAVNKDSKAAEQLLSRVSRAKPGAYTITWQVLSVDGHITRGEIRFQVQ